MMDEVEAVPYCDVELLSVDGLYHHELGDLRVGISLAIDDDQIDVSLSLDDAEKMILALAKAVYDLRSEDD